LRGRTPLPVVEKDHAALIGKLAQCKERNLTQDRGQVEVRVVPLPELVELSEESHLPIEPPLGLVQLALGANERLDLIAELAGLAFQRPHLITKRTDLVFECGHSACSGPPRRRR
jgi:hypothetical protein